MKRTFRFEPRLQDVEEDVRREVEAHLDERSREFEAQGMDPASARQAAIDAFGDRTAIAQEMRALHRQTVRAGRRTLYWEELRLDLAAALRGLARSPLYTAVALLVSCFALAAVLLALVGVYGLMAYVVGQRRREIGVRLAMGAAPHRLTHWLLRDGLQLTLLGVVLGLVLAVGGTRLLQANLYGVAPLDPGVLATVSLGVAVAAMVACWIPARRARSIDSVEALRSE